MQHDDVHDRATLVTYLAELRAALAEPTKAQRWENVDLPSFLEAMQAWISDSEQPANPNPWRYVADVITAATIYE